MSERTAAAWAEVLSRIIGDAHLASGEQLSAIVDRAVRAVGLSAEVLMVDLAQLVLTPVRVGVGPEDQIAVTGTMAGRAYQLGEVFAATDERGDRLLWVPMLDGAERAGVLRIGLDEFGPVQDDPDLRRWVWTLSGLAGHILMSKIVQSDRLRRWRSNGDLSPPSELLWQLVPPRTFATDKVVVSALLEPHDDVAGDAYDYNVEGDLLDLAVFDSVGHDIHAGLTTALAITAIRNARRAGERDLMAMAARADEFIAEQKGPPQFATAVLARLDTATGFVHYLLAGHPPPLLVRQGKVVKELVARPRTPLGIPPPARSTPAVGVEQLEPGDKLLLYSDGITEARDADGEFFGQERLVEFTEHAAAAELSAPETLRRLGAAVLRHQDGHLQDDATLLLVDWSASGPLRMLAALSDDPG